MPGPFISEITNPEDPESVAQAHREVADAINGNLSIGEPIATFPANHPVSPLGVDTSRPNGLKGNLEGSFVTRADITITNIGYAFAHNLNVPVKGNPANGELNVGWVVVRLIHDGTGTGAYSTISCNYDTNDSAQVLANSIALRFYIGEAGGVASRTLAGHPITASIWFFPTTR